MLDQRNNKDEIKKMAFFQKALLTIAEYVHSVLK